MPIISVVIPTYNRKAYVQKAIESVLRQTYDDYEVIVIDDGSVDGTNELICKYDGNIRYQWQPNQGESVARNRGIELAKGKYIAFLDSDDIWQPNKLAFQIDFLESNPDTNMVFSQAFQIDAEGNRIRDNVIGVAELPENFTLERLCFENYITSPSTVVVDKKALLSAGGFDPNIHFGEDWDLWLRLRLFTQVDSLPMPLACLRRHKDTQCYYPSSEQNSERRESQINSLRKLFAIWTAAPEGLPQRAFAWQYARSALLEASVGNQKAMIMCLEKANELDPSLIEDAGRFGTAIANQSALLYDLSESGDLQSSQLFLKTILDAIVEIGNDDWLFQRKALGRSYESLGFMAYSRNEYRLAWYNFIRAIAKDLTLAKNLGIWSILYHTIID